VSEATIYTRYGFGPATWSTDIAIDARRAGWIGGEVPGRVQLVSRATGMDLRSTVFEEARRARPGDVQIVGHRFGRLFGAPSDPAEQRKRRFARYDDADGTPRGLVIYRLVEPAQEHTDFTNFTVDVIQLVATTEDAYRALWRFVLELDLVGTVKAWLRSVDEPLRWLVRDPRRIRTTELREHLWIRVLDPVAALTARTYAGPGRLTLRVADPLGHADGTFAIAVDESGAATVERGEAEEGPLLEVPVDVLGSLYLGGASAAVLLAAGRLAERTPGDAALADRLLRPPVAPVLTTWF
jgi:predicted acetyltransferase